MFILGNVPLPPGFPNIPPGKLFVCKVLNIYVKLLAQVFYYF